MLNFIYRFSDLQTIHDYIINYGDEIGANGEYQYQFAFEKALDKSVVYMVL